MATLNKPLPKESHAEERQAGTVEADFQAGGIKATVWKNQIDDTRYALSVRLQRSYMDKAGKWQTSGSFRANDVPKAVLVLQKAFEHMVLKGGADEE
jgi:hypothetical protein